MALAGTAFADFKGHHTPGGWGMFSGTQTPAPGSAIISGIYTRYHSDKLVDRYGDDLNLSGKHRDLTSDSYSLFAWWVSDYKILGANWGMLGSVFGTDNSLEYAGLDFDASLGMGDLYWQPLNLGWHLKQADFILSYGIYFPTGRYDANADDNTGMGMWTHEFCAGSTLYLNKAKNWSVSAAGYYEINTEKDDTDTTVGDILTIEGGLGRSWYEGAFSAGLAYYAQWKMTDDKVGGLQEVDDRLPNELSLNRSRLFGLGPELNFPILIKKKPICFVTVRYQWELEARSTLEGQNLNVFLNFPWGMGE